MTEGHLLQNLSKIQISNVQTSERGGGYKYSILPQFHPNFPVRLCLQNSRSLEPAGKIASLRFRARPVTSQLSPLATAHPSSRSPPILRPPRTPSYARRSSIVGQRVPLQTFCAISALLCSPSINRKGYSSSARTGRQKESNSVRCAPLIHPGLGRLTSIPSFVCFNLQTKINKK
jgi:hypothetical protein